MAEQNLTENLTNKATWFRLLLAILFFFVNSVLRLVVGLVFVAQFLFVLVTGERNRRLLDFANVLTDYIYQIVAFITFRADERPFPFNDLPRNDRNDVEANS